MPSHPLSLPSLMRPTLIIVSLLLTSVCAAATEPAPVASLGWRDLAPLPDAIGFAGPFAGTSNGALVVAGGANFPVGPPWEGNPKVWHDRIFVLVEPGGQWRQVEQRLARPLGYG